MTSGDFSKDGLGQAGDGADDAGKVGVVEWVLPSNDEDLAVGLMAEFFPDGFEVSDGSTLGGGEASEMTLRAYVSRQDAEQAARKLVSAVAGLVADGSLHDPGRILAHAADQVDWVEQVRRGFAPLTVGRFHIRPPWDSAGEAPADEVEGGTSRNGASVELVVLPGAAFGTGRHPTTRLCLRALEVMADEGVGPTRVLDLGAGSGLLALAAAKLWPDATVTASEPDEDALESCRDNLRLNDLQDRVEATTDTSLERRSFDLVVANIRLDTLLSYSAAFAEWVEQGGLLVLSGLLEDETNPMIESLRRDGEWDLLRTSQEEEWRCLVLRAKSR